LRTTGLIVAFAGGDLGGAEVGPAPPVLDGAAVVGERVGPDDGAGAPNPWELDCEHAAIDTNTPAVTTRRRTTSLFRPPATP
jgi:hypothetical protein